MTNLLSLSTESPHTKATADETLALLAAFPPPGGAERHRALVEASGVRSRSVVARLERLAQLSTIDERNALYGRLAVPLAERVARAALAAASLNPQTVGALLVTSSTGHMLPTLDCHLAARLNVPASARRLALNDLGCAGAVRAVACAADLLEGAALGIALVVAVDLCSLWMQIGEVSPDDVRSNVLFGDGAGAVVLASSAHHGTGPELLARSSVVWPDSLTARGARLTSSGLRHFGSAHIARLVARHVRRTVDDFLSAQGLSRADLAFFAMNPSDLALATCIANQLGLPEHALAMARSVWELHGNTLAVGPLHMLRTVHDHRPRTDVPGLLLVLGPGITCDLLLMRWNGHFAVSHRDGDGPAFH